MINNRFNLKKWVRFNFFIDGCGLILSHQEEAVDSHWLLELSSPRKKEQSSKEFTDYMFSTLAKLHKKSLPYVHESIGHLGDVEEYSFYVSQAAYQNYVSYYSKYVKSTTKEKEVEMTSAIKEDVQTVQQILGALQQDKLLVVTVKFPNNSEKEYYYKTLDSSIEVGSHVVIDSPYSGIIALPVEAIANAKIAGVSNQLLGSLKWVVQKVDFTNYLDNTAQEKQVKEDLLKSIEAKRAQDVLEYARQTFGAGVNAVLDGYVNGLSNGDNTKVLEAPKEKKVVGRGRQTSKTIVIQTKEK